MPTTLEHKENQEVRPKIVEMAEKRRHIHLLEKLSRNQPLSRAETGELARLEKGRLPPGWFSTPDEIAVAFAVDPRTVRRWIVAGMPMDSRGFNLLEISEWRRRREDVDDVSGECVTLNRASLEASTKETLLIGIRRGVSAMSERFRKNSGVLAKTLVNKSQLEVKSILDNELIRLEKIILESKELQTQEGREEWHGSV